MRIKGNVVGARFDDGLEFFNPVKVVHLDEGHAVLLLRIEGRAVKPVLWRTIWIYPMGCGALSARREVRSRSGY